MNQSPGTVAVPGLSHESIAGRHCPQCVWPYLHAVWSGHQTQLRCESCGHCWRVEHGDLRPVDPPLAPRIATEQSAAPDRSTTREGDTPRRTHRARRSRRRENIGTRRT
jgi:hypothetical protein